MSKYHCNTESQNSTQSSIAHGTVGTANELAFANKLKKIELMILNSGEGHYGNAQLQKLLDDLD